MNLGIELLRLNGNAGLSEGLPPDTMGYITTYAGMGKFPDLHATFCGSKPTLVIFDEVHHLNESDNTKWGKAAKGRFFQRHISLCLPVWHIFLV